MLKKLRMLLAAAVIAAIPMYAQEVRASLSGVVSDPVGAPVPGVTVVLTSVERNVATTTETNEQGNYLFPFVVSGKYTLTIERTGFKKYVRQNIILEAQDKARADVALEVGDMTQSVNVQADVSQLQTETASRSQIVSNQLIANLPTQGRNPFQIAWAMPGVVKTGDMALPPRLRHRRHVRLLHQRRQEGRQRSPHRRHQQRARQPQRHRRAVHGSRPGVQGPHQYLRLAVRPHRRWHRHHRVKVRRQRFPRHRL
ncbi:MAG: carboxypeptidase-like regulatory domain-containing protein [Paludibaculum sp.]